MFEKMSVNELLNKIENYLILKNSLPTGIDPIKRLPRKKYLINWYYLLNKEDQCFNENVGKNSYV